MAEFTAAALDLPALQAAGAIALAHLDDAAAAATRLTDPADHEALHDFRVAVRRLRVTVRAYPGLREFVSAKQRRRLRNLARATDAARDAEVQIAWFRTRSKRFTPPQRAALGPLRARLRAQRRRELRLTQPELLRQFGRLERKLRPRLTVLETDARPQESPFRGIAAASLVQHATDLSSRLRAVSPAATAAEVHATRIAAKRLRYLLEPVLPGVTDAGSLIERLKQLQDVLGELTDAHTLEQVLRDGGPAARVLEAEVAGLFVTLREAWSQAGPGFVAGVNAVARQLRPVTKTPPSRRRRSA
jgi:CHAD domain-containing protein